MSVRPVGSSVTVAQEPLELYVQVRVLAPQYFDPVVGPRPSAVGRIVEQEQMGGRDVVPRNRGAISGILSRRCFTSLGTPLGAGVQVHVLCPWGSTRPRSVLSQEVAG